MKLWAVTVILVLLAASGAAFLKYRPDQQYLPEIRSKLPAAPTLPSLPSLPAAPSAPATEISAFFSPKGGCTDAIVAELSRARKTVRLQAYSFTSAAIAKALADAHARGVDVRVILDKSQRTERYSSATFLLNHSIPVFIDDRHAIAHNKIIIIDDETLLTGSFNFTKAAEENNAENLLLIRSNPKLISSYNANFDAHLAHSQPYAGPTGGSGVSR